VRRDPKKDAALVKSFAHQADFELLQVAEPAVDHLRRLAAATGGEVTFLDEGDGHSSQRGIPGDTGSGGAASYDRNVELFATEPLEVRGARSKREVAARKSAIRLDPGNRVHLRWLNFDLGLKHVLISPNFDV
jgi:hypothetical protein